MLGELWILCMFWWVLMYGNASELKPSVAQLSGDLGEVQAEDATDLMCLLGLGLK